jgi:hypothetical protein
MATSERADGVWLKLKDEAEPVRGVNVRVADTDLFIPCMRTNRELPAWRAFATETLRNSRS